MNNLTEHFGQTIRNSDHVVNSGFGQEGGGLCSKILVFFIFDVLMSTRLFVRTTRFQPSFYFKRVYDTKIIYFNQAKIIYIAALAISFQKRSIINIMREYNFEVDYSLFKFQLCSDVHF